MSATRRRPDPVRSRAGRRGRVDPSLTAWRRQETARLSRRGDSITNIARYLGVDERTVQRYRAEQRQPA